MYPLERRSKIIELMREGGVAEIGQLSQQMGVSESTVRRDLRRLEDDGIVEVHYGAARLKQQSCEFVARPYPERAVLHAKEKALIAKAALRLIEGETSILLDAGSTTAEIAKELQTWP
ncbi:MAG: DeoR family transcriptional regulator, partial [Firmicutes bacterium]|nr:DeoR family transcriptional regulator [Bacillota bacterium]